MIRSAPRPGPVPAPARAPARAAALAAALAVVLAGQPALANWVSENFARMGFGNDDYAAARDAAATLFEGDEPIIGELRLWENEASGARGAVEITEQFVRADGRLCIRLRHIAQTRRMANPAQFRGLRCRADDGRWLIAAE